MKFQKSVSKYALFSLINFPFLWLPFYFIDINLMCPCHETDSNVIHNTFAASFASLYFLLLRIMWYSSNQPWHLTIVRIFYIYHNNKYSIHFITFCISATWIIQINIQTFSINYVIYGEIWMF